MENNHRSNVHLALKISTNATTHNKHMQTKQKKWNDP